MGLTLKFILLVTKMLKGIVTMRLIITMPLHHGSRADFHYHAHRALFFNYFNVPNSIKSGAQASRVMAILLFPVAIVNFYYLEVFNLWIFQ
jgi:hypothetical protein